MRSLSLSTLISVAPTRCEQESLSKSIPSGNIIELDSDVEMKEVPKLADESSKHDASTSLLDSLPDELLFDILKRLSTKDYTSMVRSTQRLYITPWWSFTEELALLQHDFDKDSAQALMQRQLNLILTDKKLDPESRNGELKEMIATIISFFPKNDYEMKVACLKPFIEDKRLTEFWQNLRDKRLGYQSLALCTWCCS